MTRIESLQKMTRVVAQMTRLDHLLRFEPLADNLIIFMKKYGFERALCMHDIFKSRQFEFEFTFSAKRRIVYLRKVHFS